MASRKIEADVVVKVTGADDVADVADAVKELSDTTSKVRVEVEGEEQVKALTKEFAGLDNVTVTATAKVANQANVDEFIRNVRGFDNETATAILAVRAGQAETELKSLIVTIADINSTPAEVKVASDRLPAVRAELDQLSAAIKDVASVPVDVNTAPAAASLRRIGESASQSSGLVANAMGNATQDMLGFAGVTGTAGQAVGQLAEEFIQAAGSAGNMGAAMAEVGKAAAPIAAIVAISSSLGSIFEAQAARAKQAASAVEQLTEALAGGGDESLAIANSLRENIGAMQSFNADARTAWGGFVEGATAAANAIPLIGSLIPDNAFQNITNVAEAFTDAGISAYDLGTALRKGGVDVTAMKVQLELLADAGQITGDQAAAAAQQIDVLAEATENARAVQALYNVDQAEANALLQAAKDPLTQYTDQWEILKEDMADGTINSVAAADAINLLADKLGLTHDQVVELAQEDLTEDLDAQAKAAENAAEAAQKYADELEKAAVATAAAQMAINDLTSGFAIMAERGDALQSIFDLGNAPVDALSDIADVHEGIRGLAEFVSKDLKGRLPNIFNPDDVNADDFLAKIQSLRQPIQEQITAAFASGGPEAAQKVADDYVGSIVAALGGKLTAEEVRNLLNLGDLQAKIDIAVDQSKLALAKQSLDILVGLGGATPYTASIALALQTGSITPEVAQAAINQQLAGAGVEIPSTLAVPDAGQATVAAAIWAKEHPAEFPSTLDPTGAEAGASDFAGGTQPTATIPGDADMTQAERDRQGFVDKTNATRPMIDVSANITAALVTMAIINAIAKAMAPTVDIHADTTDVYSALSNIRTTTTRTAVDAYLRDWPTASEIAARIGPVRVPIDAYVRSTERVTGVRD